MKTIQLTKGKVAIVDDEDYPRLSEYTWQCSSSGYAVRHSPRSLGHKTIRMHREVVSTPAGMHTDHINGNALDNRRENLRVCTCSQNLANSKICRANTSGYKGVTWSRAEMRWRAQIEVNGRKLNLGGFIAVTDAARAYDQAAREHFGEFARVNFQSESTGASLITQV